MRASKDGEEEPFAAAPQEGHCQRKRPHALSEAEDGKGGEDGAARTQGRKRGGELLPVAPDAPPPAAHLHSILIDASPSSRTKTTRTPGERPAFRQAHTKSPTQAGTRSLSPPAQERR